MRTLAAAVVTVVIAVSLAGCGSADATKGQEPAAQAGVREQSMVQLLRATSAFRYTPYDSPRAMLANVDVAMVGVVEHVSAAVVADELDGQGALVVAIRPSETWKGHPANKSGLVHFSVARPKNVSVDVYDAALPRGTRVVMFGVLHPPSTSFTSGDPGVSTYVPVPQGLFLPDESSALENVWGDDGAGAGWDGTSTLEGLREATLRP